MTFFNNKIYHMASMARSGETLMLKILAVHPDIKVIHNLDKEDDHNSLKAFEFLKNYKPKRISRKHKLIKPYQVNKSDVLLIKQGVWKHLFPFDGFILSRNPVSIYSSLKSYDKKEAWYNSDNNYWTENSNRFERWLKDINPTKIDEIISKPPVEQFVDFYNLRMGYLLDLGLPIIRYEDLLTNTEETLIRVCEILGVSMHEELLNSHRHYDKGYVGHGQNDLSKPIDLASLTKYKTNVTEEEFDYIMAHTENVHKVYGYSANLREVTF